MSRFYRLVGVGFAAALTACTASAASTSAPTATEVMPPEPTVFVITASVGTAEPVTVLPPNQVTPVTYVAPTPTPIPPIPGGLGPTELKYRVLAEFPDFFFCDPDFYPIAIGDEMEKALQRFPEIQANAEEFNTILAHNGLSQQITFSDDQKLLIYQEHKKLAAMQFTLTGAGYQFQIQVARAEGSGELVSGMIDAQGTITVQNRQPSFATCPICLAAGTLIDTPAGPIPVQNLRVGTLVWTVDRSGARVAMPVLRVGSTLVSSAHQVVHLALSDGRELWVSPGHPTTDGRLVGALRVGDWLDGARVVVAERVPYTGSATYDLLPAGDTGFYWANGILIASTLAR